MTMENNGSGHIYYRCRHRGEGCALPRRSANGLIRAGVLGMQLIGRDKRLQEAIRRELAGPGGTARRGRHPGGPGTADALAALTEQRRKLLRLHYDGQISADLFAEEESRLSAHIDAAGHEQRAQIEESERVHEMRERFD
jgi:hypothetical protein